MKTDYKLEQIDMTKPLYLIVEKAGMNHGEIYEEVENIQIEDVDKYNRYKEDEYIEFYKNLDGATKCELVGTDAIFSRPVEIYRLN